MANKKLIRKYRFFILCHLAGVRMDAPIILIDVTPLVLAK